MAAKDATRRVVSATFSTAFALAVGGGFDEEIEWDVNRPGTEVGTAARAMRSYDLSAHVRFQGHAAPRARGGSPTSLVFVLAKFDNAPGASANSVTVTLPLMVGSSAHGDFSADPHESRQDFVFTGDYPCTIAVT